MKTGSVKSLRFKPEKPQRNPRLNYLKASALIQRKFFCAAISKLMSFFKLDGLLFYPLRRIG